jgi:hypothetical protein
MMLRPPSQDHVSSAFGSLGRALTIVASALALASATVPLQARGQGDAQGSATLSAHDQAIIKSLGLGKTASHSTHDARLEHPKDFPQVTLVATFASDRGYRLRHVFVKTQRYDPKTCSAAVLQSAGWTTASPEERSKLALAYVVQVEHAFGSHLLQSCPPALERQQEIYSPPQAQGTSKGHIEVRYWEQEPTGMRPVLGFSHCVEDFAHDGSVTRRVERRLEVDVR